MDRGGRKSKGDQQLLARKSVGLLVKNRIGYLGQTRPHPKSCSGQGFEPVQSLFERSPFLLELLATLEAAGILGREFGADHLDCGDTARVSTCVGLVGCAEQEGMSRGEES